MTRTPSEPSAAGHALVLGDVMTDIVVQLAAPIALGSDTPAAISMHGGGSGANQAAWLASVAPAPAVHFVGCVGNDPLGAAHRKAMRRVGASAHFAVDPKRPTGAVVSMVDASGERSMLTERGANVGLRVDALPRTLFREGAWLHISGYTLLEEETRPVALEAIRLAKARGMSVSVDPASEAMLIAAGPANFMEWTSGADLCFPNLDEGRLLSGETEPEAVARALCANYSAIALKLGAGGAVWAGRGKSTATQACVPAKVVDTTGAGDAFCAGFLSVWLRDCSPEGALAAGAALAAVAVAQAGARPTGGDLRL